MTLLLFTRALACAQHADFGKTNAAQTIGLARTTRAPRLRCVWSRDADGRLACRWLRDDAADDEGMIPLAAIRRFPQPAAPTHAPLRAPTPTRVTDRRRGSGNTPEPAVDNRFAPGHAPRPPMSSSHVRHVRPA